MCVVVGDHTRGTHVEVRGQPQMLVLAFHLVWSSLLIAAAYFRHFPINPWDYRLQTVSTAMRVF